MADPPRTQIIDALVTLLGTITVANGYKNTVATVERVVRVYPGEQELPVLGVSFQRQRYTYEAVGALVAKMNGAIVAHVDAATDEERGAAMADMEDDLIAAIHLDPTLGGVCVDCRIDPNADAVTDAEDPDAPDSRGNVARLLLPLEIKYRRTGAAS